MLSAEVRLARQWLDGQPKTPRKRLRKVREVSDDEHRRNVRWAARKRIAEIRGYEPLGHSSFPPAIAFWRVPEEESN